MSVIHELTKAAEREFFRGLQGGDRGILRAIANRAREHLTVDDYEFAQRLLALMLEREWQSVVRGRESDDEFDERARKIAEANSRSQIQRMRSNLTWRDEVDGNGGRSSSAAVNNEAHRHQWETNRLMERALALKDGS